MIKKEFVEKVYLKLRADDAGVGKAQTEKVLKVCFDTIAELLSKGDSILWPGFGKFEARRSAPRKARNIRTGELIDVEESKRPAFSPAQDLKAKVKGINKK